MAQQTHAATEEMDDNLAPCVETFGVPEGSESAFADFIEAALSEARDMVVKQQQEAEAAGMVEDDDPTLSELFSPENCRSVEWEDPDFKGSRVTVWLSDCPIWANNAETVDLKVGHYNDRNRKMKATIDVRPF